MNRRLPGFVATALYSMGVLDRRCLWIDRRLSPWCEEPSFAVTNAIDHFEHAFRERFEASNGGADLRYHLVVYRPAPLVMRPFAGAPVRKPQSEIKGPACARPFVVWHAPQAR